MEGKRFLGSQIEVQLHSRMCFGPYYDVGDDKMATAHTHKKTRHAHRHARSQTIASAMMDVRMQTYSKQKIDEFPSFQPNGKCNLDGSRLCIT